MGRFPASHERLLKLAALRMQFFESDYTAGATMWEHELVAFVALIHVGFCCSDDVTEVYPMVRIVQEASSQKDIYGQGNLQETYYAVSLL